MDQIATFGMQTAAAARVVTVVVVGNLNARGLRANVNREVALEIATLTIRRLSGVAARRLAVEGAA